MQSVANWVTRTKWFLIFALLVWGAFFWATGYTECRAEGHNNVACDVAALFLAWLGVILHILAAVIAFFSWSLP
jgi:hypothetical protein